MNKPQPGSGPCASICCHNYWQWKRAGFFFLALRPTNGNLLNVGPIGLYDRCMPHGLQNKTQAKNLKITMKNNSRLRPIYSSKNSRDLFQSILRIIGGFRGLPHPPVFFLLVRMKIPTDLPFRGPYNPSP